MNLFYLWFTVYLTLAEFAIDYQIFTRSEVEDVA